jgi:surfactin synthase thioesterase subunit
MPYDRGPRVRLLLFHHAGGSAAGYRPWARIFPHGWEVVCVEYPGRRPDDGAPAARDMRTLVDTVMACIAPLTDTPYALFGHSMGSLVAFEVAHRARAAGLPAPAWLGVSGRAAPHRPTRARYLVHKLSDDALWDAVRSLGASPAEPALDARARAAALDRLRADFQACETYRPPERPRLALPIAAYVGADDPMCTPAEARHWAELTTEALRVRRFPGGHFYLHAARHDVARQIVADVGAALGRSAPAPEQVALSR